MNNGYGLIERAIQKAREDHREDFWGVVLYPDGYGELLAVVYGGKENDGVLARYTAEDLEEIQTREEETLERCDILHRAADMAEKIDAESLNRNYESVTTVVTDWLRELSDYPLYLSAMMIAHGGERRRWRNHTNLLYTTRDLSREEQVEKLRLAAGIIANRYF